MNDKRLSRRAWIRAALATPASALLANGAEARGPQAADRALSGLAASRQTRLVLLGTGGGPRPGQARRMTSHVMVHGGAAYILDCGLGVTDQFARTGIPFGAVRAVGLTHHHPDHNIEYGPFLTIGWIQGLQPSRVLAFGPPPLRQMTADYLRSAQTTLDFWASDFKLPPFGGLEVQDLDAPGPVLRDDHVSVTSALVQHPPVKPAYAYRFDFPDRSIVFSGDTVALDAVAELARGADVLVHEAMYVPAMEAYVRDRMAHGFRGSFDAMMSHMKADHTPVEEVGRIAAEARVRTLVLSHLTPSVGVDDDTWRAAAARSFKGRIVVGSDLTVI